MTNSDTPAAEGHQTRRTVTLGRAKVARFRALLRERGHVGSTLVYIAVLDGAIRAKTGLRLPASGTEATGGGERSGLMWSQRDSEHEEWSALIEAAGSSLRDVVGDFVHRYNAAGGDLLSIEEGRCRPELPLAG